MNELLRACAQGDFLAVQRCLNSHPNLKQRDSRGWAPLDVAADQGNPEVVQALLKAGADPCAGDLGGYTPLYRAIKALQQEAALLLLEASDRRPISRERNLLSEVVGSLLPDNPVTPDSLLILAAENGLTRLVQTMLAQARATHPAKERALVKAACRDRVGCVELLAALPQLDSLGEALDCALLGGHKECARILLERGAQPGERALEHTIANQSELLEDLGQRFPEKLDQARARVHCKHTRLERSELGQWCLDCGLHWP